MVKHVNGRVQVRKALKFLENTREFTKERAVRAKSFILRQPVLSTFLGLGAGLLVGMLFSRRVPKVVVVVRPKGTAT